MSTVTDHAIVRYFERVLGVNMDEVREAIVSREAIIRSREMHLTTAYFPIPDTGFVAVYSNGSVVTVRRDPDKQRFGTMPNLGNGSVGTESESEPESEPNESDPPLDGMAVLQPT